MADKGSLTGLAEEQTHTNWTEIRKYIMDIIILLIN